MADSEYTPAPEPTSDEILDRAQEIFSTDYACWPNCRPSRVAAEAKMAYLDGKLCRLDFYATTSALMLIVATSPKALRNTWPPRTPAEFAKGLGMLRDVTWPRVVKVVRDGDAMLQVH